MQIEITNLGAIKSGKVDLSRKLTVFCGPNNSGKTYVAFIIYALTKSGNKFFRNEKGESIIGDLLKNDEIIFDLDFDEIWKYRLNEINDIKSSLDSIYGISEDISSHLFKNFDISIVQSKDEFISEITGAQFFNEVELKSTKVQIIKNINEKFVTLKLQGKLAGKSDIEVLGLFLISKIYSIVAFYPFTSSYILPVERNSIYTFSKELSIQKHELLDQAQQLGSKKSKDPFY